MRKVGMFFAYWSQDWQADFRYYIKKAANLGFDCLEISTFYLTDMSKDNLNEIKKTAIEHGIELTYCVGLPEDKDLASNDQIIRHNGIEYVKRTLEIIHDMGGNLFSGIYYSNWPARLPQGITDKSPILERSIASMKQVTRTAEDYGITLCMEVVNRYEHYLLNTAQEGLDFIHQINSPNVKLLLDTFHMNVEEDNFYDAIVTAGDKLGHFHIGECNRKVPGKGHMPWDEIFRALEAIHYSGKIVMEPFVRMGGEVGRDINIWRDLSNGADETQLDHDALLALAFVRSLSKNQ